MIEDMLSWLRREVEADKAGAETAANEPREVEYTYPDGPVNGMSWEPRMVPDGGHWTYTEGASCVVSEPAGLPTCNGGVVGGSCGCCVQESEGRPVDLAHIARHDPRDTIARCEAELRLIALYEVEDWRSHGRTPDYWEGLREALEAIAYARRHRPGYLPEWAPEGTTP